MEKVTVLLIIGTNNGPISCHYLYLDNVIKSRPPHSGHWAKATLQISLISHSTNLSSWGRNDSR